MRFGKRDKPKLTILGKPESLQKTPPRKRPIPRRGLSSGSRERTPDDAAASSTSRGATPPVEAGKRSPGSPFASAAGPDPGHREGRRLGSYQVTATSTPSRRNEAAHFLQIPILSRLPRVHVGGKCLTRGVQHSEEKPIALRGEAEDEGTTRRKNFPRRIWTETILCPVPVGGERSLCGRRGKGRSVIPDFHRDIGVRRAAAAVGVPPRRDTLFVHLHWPDLPGVLPRVPPTAGDRDHRAASPLGLSLFEPAGLSGDQRREGDKNDQSNDEGRFRQECGESHRV